MLVSVKNAIVTGASGFIGVHLLEELLLHDYHVIVVVRHNSNHLDRIIVDKRVTVIELDMGEIQLLPDYLTEKQYDTFFHLAWEGIRAAYREDQSLQNSNYENAVKAMEAAKQLKCKTFLGIGSQAEYGNCIGDITEETIPKPVSEYGKAKLKAYHVLNKLSAGYDMKFIWARLFSVYGKYDYEGTFIMSTLKKLIKNEDILLSEGRQSWDFIHVEDAVRAIYLLGDVNCTGGIYNIASGYNRPLREFVQDMKQIAQSGSRIEFGSIPYGPEGMVSIKPSVDKLKSNLNWSCRVSFEEGILNLLK